MFSPSHTQLDAADQNINQIFSPDETDLEKLSVPIVHDRPYITDSDNVFNSNTYNRSNSENVSPLQNEDQRARVERARATLPRNLVLKPSSVSPGVSTDWFSSVNEIRH
ncbi:hypothetical protein ElyMa_004479800 [Elysia marginata]|uniref:Uncharacterized protein n=1 Tax=Elysia marginata TaxID=1093978 RepID=A0AAV4HL50_9GAST|nr:hypothetical protein ElyMa_004479800 [Elysia marginata]